jgi:hypothetical protein
MSRGIICPLNYRVNKTFFIRNMACTGSLQGNAMSSYNFTDLMTFESPCTDVWMDRPTCPGSSRIAREILNAVPDLSNKGMCVGIYNNQGEAISYVPLDALH